MALVVKRIFIMENNSYKFDGLEKEVFEKLISIAIRNKKRDLWELIVPGGNRSFIPQEEDLLEALFSIEEKTKRICY